MSVIVVLVLTKQVDFVFVGVAYTFIWQVSSSVTVAKRAAILKISSGDGCPRIYRVWWTNQSARKVLSTCLVNTDHRYTFALQNWYMPYSKMAGTQKGMRPSVWKRGLCGKTKRSLWVAKRTMASVNLSSASLCKSRKIFAVLLSMLFFFALGFTIPHKPRFHASVLKFYAFPHLWIRSVERSNHHLVIDGHLFGVNFY